MKERNERVLDALNAARKAQEELKEKIRGEVTAYLKENEGGLNADEPKRKDLEHLKWICKNY